MKKLIIIALTLFSLQCVSQITFETSLVSNPGYPSLYSGIGYKLMAVSPSNSNVWIYRNIDYSLYDSIDVTPPAGLVTTSGSAPENSQLFNSDTLIEVIRTYYNSSTFQFLTEIRNSSGIVLSLPDYRNPSVCYYGDGIYKLHVQSALDNSWSIFSLPGTLPCDDRCSSTIGMKVMPGIVKQMKLFPNPTENLLTIETYYEMRNIQVVNILGQLVLEDFCQAKQKILNVSSLNPGTYLIKITLKNGEVVSGSWIKS